MGRRHRNFLGSCGEEMRYSSFMWEMDKEPDWSCLADALNILREETQTVLIPVGYELADGLYKLRIDGQFDTNDEGEIKHVAQRIEKLVGHPVSTRELLFSLEHSADVQAINRLHSAKDTISRYDFEQINNVDTPSEATDGTILIPRFGDEDRNSPDRLFISEVKFSLDTNWDSLRVAVALLYDDCDVEFQVGAMDFIDGMIKARIFYRLVSRFRRQDMSVAEISEMIHTYLGIECKLRELGHTMMTPEDMELLASLERPTGRYRRRHEDPIEQLKEFAETQAKKGGSASTSLSGTSQQLFKSMIGLAPIKQQLKEIAGFAKARMDAGFTRPVMHMCFRGNPGTGKTTMARIFAKLLAEQGVIESEDAFIEVDREQLVGIYVGWTAHQTKRIIREARGGILFIDEAYSLAGEGNDFGPEAIATLVKAMEDDNQDLIVILAGYTEPMDRMISINPGLRDRIAFYLDFPDYSADELSQVARRMARKDGYGFTSAATAYLKEQLRKVVAAKDEDFANARLVRKIVERAAMRQATLLGADTRIKKDAVVAAFEDADLKALIRRQASPIGFGSVV